MKTLGQLECKEGGEHMSKYWLETVFWISQIAMLLVALGRATLDAGRAARVATDQLLSFQLFEIIKYIESNEMREDRRTVMTEIKPRQNDEWWKDPKKGADWEAAATNVCVGYDVLARVTKFDRFGDLESFFQQNWAPTARPNRSESGFPRAADGASLTH
jgi:hypothetical protein